MKVFIPDAPEHFIAERKRTGADQWDEMWEGVLHMPPMPNFGHQDLEAALQNYVWLLWARPLGARVLHQINLAEPGTWPNNYRIPDLMLLTPERLGIVRGTYCDGAPDVVVEIHSPNDESYDKLPFYRKLGVPEVWIIDRDTKEPEIYVLRRGRYRKQPAGAGGWVRSAQTGVEVKAGRRGKLAIRIGGDDATLEEIPTD